MAKPTRRIMRRSGVRKMIVVLALICVLAVATTGLGQRRSSGTALEEEPPRQMQKANPLPWLAAFAILAVALVPAFKSSKREMGG